MKIFSGLYLITAVLACSDRNQPLSVKIVSGQEAAPGDYPFMVRIVEAAELNEPAHNGCGGALISPRHVLTAAHCVEGDLYAIIGEHDTRVVDADEQRIKVKAFIAHAEFGAKPGPSIGLTFHHDVAVLLLEQDAAPNFRPITIDLDPAEVYGRFEAALTLGWGAQSGYLLNELRLTPVSRNECHQSLNNPAEHVLCAKSDSKAVDPDVDFIPDKNVEFYGATCNGDSGGPLIAFSESDREYKHIGIVNNSHCGSPHFKHGDTSIFMQTSMFRNWIGEARRQLQ